MRNYKGKEMSQFEQWFEQQDFYTNMRFIHGDALFTKDGDVYRVLPVQMTYTAHKHQQAEKVGFQKLVKSLRSEFDLNGGSDQVERQIELLEEALRGEHE